MSESTDEIHKSTKLDQIDVIFKDSWNMRFNALRVDLINNKIYSYFPSFIIVEVAGVVEIFLMEDTDLKVCKMKIYRRDLTICILMEICRHGLSNCKIIRISSQHIDGLVQDCSYSSALVMELLWSCTKPSICVYFREIFIAVSYILLPLFHSYLFPTWP